MNNTDGNLAALNSYLREQDALDAQDEAERQERQEQADGMFDAYFEGDEEAVEELNDMIYSNADNQERLLEILRRNFDPSPANDGKALQNEYREFIIEMCDEYHGVN